MSAPFLATQALTKNFGGLFAVRDVSINFDERSVHVIIGPNGAGKTTLIDLLSGDLAPSGGSITYRAQDITRLASHRLSQIGIGRSYQITNVFANFTCHRNVWLAAQSRMPSSMRFFRGANRYGAVRTRAERALARVGLSHRADEAAAAMSHGEQRQLEIAMLLATEPQVLLLDEPLAGMGAEETERMILLIRELGKNHCIVLIEHDMDAVFAVADRVTVMVDGAVLATGNPDQIRESATVRQAYLGGEVIAQPSTASV